MTRRTPHPAGRLLGGAAFLLLALGSIVLTALGKLPAKVGWPAVAIGVAGALAPVLIQPLSQRLNLRTATTHSRNAALERLYRTGAIVEIPVQQVDPARLGIHPAWKLPGTPSVPPYVPRTADTVLDRALEGGGLVVIHGHSAAGKSRTAYEALRRNAHRLGWRKVLVPQNAEALRVLAEATPDLANVVIWLDDLDHYLTAEGLDDGLLSIFNPPGRSDVVVLATLRSRARDALGVDKDEATVPACTARRVLTGSTPIRLDRDLNPEELDTAKRYRFDPRIAAALDSPSGAGLAEHMAAAPAAAQRWQDGRDGADEQAAALISAAVDLRRAGYLEPVPLAWLAELHTIYLAPRTRHRLGDGDLAKAVAWATEPVRGASSCLLPAGQDRYVAFEYLVDDVDLRPGAPDVPDEVWQRLVSTAVLAESSLARIAWRAFGRGQMGIAIQIWSDLAAAGGDLHDYAMFHLGAAAQARDELDEAERWYLRAAKLGNSRAMSNLGTIAELRDDYNTAHTWYGRAADAGLTLAMTNLGSLLLKTGHVYEARAQYQRAADAGDPAGFRKQAALEWEHGNAQQALTLLQRALQAGDATSARLLGMLLRTLPEDAGVTQDEIESLYRLAVEMGDTEAMCEMARVHVQRGELDAAETWVRRALTRVGDTGAGQALAELTMGMLMEVRRRPRDEEAWYRRATARGHPVAMANLGVVLSQRGEYDEAEDLFRAALTAGLPQAEVNLGTLYRQRGMPGEARRWYRRAADRGDLLAKQALREMTDGDDTGQADQPRTD